MTALRVEVPWFEGNVKVLEKADKILHWLNKIDNKFYNIFNNKK